MRTVRGSYCEVLVSNSPLLRPDDPYYYLYYGDAARVPWYLSLELEQPDVGRVLRFDSLSKVVSAGIRTGFLSGPEPLMQAIDMHLRTASLRSLPVHSKP